MTMNASLWALSGEWFGISHVDTIETVKAHLQWAGVPFR
jgi:hypothetical protein